MLFCFVSKVGEETGLPVAKETTMSKHQQKKLSNFVR